MNIPKIVGHRGCSLAPENTMAAFREAYGRGAKAVELDIQCSQDGQMVVCHDDTLDRTTDGHGRLTEKNWAELARLDAGSWFSPQYAGEKLPLLSEVLGWAKDKLDVFVEIKVGPRPADFDEKFLQLLDDTGMKNQVHVISFDRDVIHRLEQKAPALHTGILFAEKAVIGAAKRGAVAGLLGGAVLGGCLGGPLGAGLGALGGVVAGGLSGLFAGRRAESREWQAEQGHTDMVLPFWLSLDRWSVGQAHTQGLAVVPYTADAPALVKGLGRVGCDGVITDRPDLFAGRQVLGEQSQTQGHGGQS